jgi:hypothetical protein
LKCEEIKGHRTLDSEVMVWYVKEIKDHRYITSLQNLRVIIRQILLGRFMRNTQTKAMRSGAIRNTTRFEGTLVL